ncbi:hypothetical protein QRD89_07885 [Halobacillus sp. ACCC02827]|nr:MULTISPECIES: hypothetical protein [Bacillaceae]ELK44605.1 hypothetical protein D479_18624 [Halobacillus sp. BAB-2008]WJE17255.1 hypothetical protein QRD89_07885 [Halobacillus sp. ACCC02827]
MRINFLIFAIFIQRRDAASIDKSIERKRVIENKINDAKLKHTSI